MWSVDIGTHEVVHTLHLYLIRIYTNVPIFYVWAPLVEFVGYHLYFGAGPQELLICRTQVGKKLQWICLRL